MVLFTLLGCVRFLRREKWIWSCYLCECVFEKKGKDIDLKNNIGEPVFWLIEENLFHLNVICDWRFTNLNKAFQNVVGSTSRSLFIYSNVGGSSTVGNQVTDLLREVNYRRTGDGSHYFEPLHIQYIPWRKTQLDIIETQVSETTGELTEFGEGNTILTLHFKRA